MAIKRSKGPAMPKVPEESYFATCERDEGGQCLPKGGSGGNQGGAEFEKYDEKVSPTSFGDPYVYFWEVFEEMKKQGMKPITPKERNALAERAAEHWRVSNPEGVAEQDQKEPEDLGSGTEQEEENKTTEEVVDLNSPKDKKKKLSFTKHTPDALEKAAQKAGKKLFGSKLELDEIESVEHSKLSALQKADEAIDDYSFIFYPSTGKGRDIGILGGEGTPDWKHYSSNWADVDGKVYVANGVDSSITVVDVDKKKS